MRPVFEDSFGIGIVVGPVEENHFSEMAVRFEELLEKGLGAAGLGEDDGFPWSGRLHRGHLLETDFEGLEQGEALGVHADAARPTDVVFELGDFLFKLGGIDGLLGGFGFRRCLVLRDFSVLFILKEFIEQLDIEIITGEELVEKGGVVFRVFLNAKKAVAHHFQSSGESTRRG
jgi:hypothetical protein